MMQQTQADVAAEVLRPAESRHWLVRLAAWLVDRWISLCLIVVPGLLGVAGILLSDEAIRWLGVTDQTAGTIRTWCFLAILVLLLAHVVLAVFHIRHEKSLSQMEQRLHQAEATKALFVENAQAVCDGYLQDLARGPLGFGSQPENSERITLYVHDSEKHFRPVGRFSFNQSFIKRGRTRYPDSQGCIGRAWEHGWSFHILPDAKSKSDEWIAECTKLGVAKTTCEKLNMKSRLYCSCALRNGTSPTPSAVIVIESTDPERYTEEGLKKVLTEDRQSYIARLVEMLKPWLGDLGHARKEGF
jgi:hypothetical protein